MGNWFRRRANGGRRHDYLHKERSVGFWLWCLFVSGFDSESDLSPARWVLLPLISCAYAGLTMVGLLGFMDWPVTVISSNFVALMLIIPMSMTVHLFVRYRQLERDEPGWSQQGWCFKRRKKCSGPCL
ncbi:MAG: hypothetical protein Ct9H300mP14_02150 [Gammaproteobacteria bacterium]|nr:MAG: hypothetical protein Ct9H300mP14_02150 [Gammaproteobacteria bacterium]